MGQKYVMNFVRVDMGFSLDSAAIAVCRKSHRTPSPKP